MARNNVDTRHGLSTYYTGVMENSRGKSQRRDSTLENSVRRENRDGTKGDSELRESARGSDFNSYSPNFSYDQMC